MEIWTTKKYKEYLQDKDKKSKYFSRKTRADGITFDSQKEANFYCQLKLSFKVKAIKGFARQVQFILAEGNDEERAITYKADFVIFNNDGSTDIVDIKGFRESREWQRTEKLFKLKYPQLILKVI
jgi:hypothetical protein